MYTPSTPARWRASTASGNVIFDWTNPAYSASAWAAYEAAGLPTPDTSHLDQRRGRQRRLFAGPTTLYGGPNATLCTAARMKTTSSAASASQDIWAGAGANIFTYLSPANSTLDGRRTTSPTSIRPRTSSTSAISTRT